MFYLFTDVENFLYLEISGKFIETNFVVHGNFKNLRGKKNHKCLKNVIDLDNSFHLIIGFSFPFHSWNVANCTEKYFLS